MKFSLQKKMYVTIIGLGMVGGRAFAQVDPARQWNANAVEATITANAGSDAVLDWNHTARTAIETLGLPPPIASYCLAMAHAAIFDAVNSIIGDYQPYVVPVSAPPGARAARRRRRQAMMYSWW
jgi:hypothetical protein